MDGITQLLNDRESFKEMIKHSMDEHAFAALDGLRKVVAADILQLEATEQIDELSKGTLGSYVKKASADASHQTGKAVQRNSMAQQSMARANDPKLRFARGGNEQIANSHAKQAGKLSDKAAQRQKGVAKAVNKLVNK